MKIIGVFCLWFMRTVLTQSSSCDYFQPVQPSTTYYISSPGYPSNYSGQIRCRWTLDCPLGYKCRLKCPAIELPESDGCWLDRLLVSKTGNPQFHGADTYCGRGSLSAVSTGQRLSIGLHTNRNTPGGRFLCEVTAEPITPTRQCRCGEKRQNRIVGGQKSGVNEYPMMAGLVDKRIAMVICGGVIISEWSVLTAAHCATHLLVRATTVIVGAHDLALDKYISSTLREHRVDRFTIHPTFDISTYDYDIAIVTVAQPIHFTAHVSPVCLPFKFLDKDFTQSIVTVLGWGTTHFGGPISRVLLKVDLDVISQRKCASLESHITDRKLCTLTPGKDSCQFDSGGPLLYTDPESGLLFNVGIVSSGRGCGQANSPGMHTRVTALLYWIITNTFENYCVI